MESGLLLDVVVRKSTSVLQLLSGKDQSLLIRWDTLLVLDLGLDVVDGIRRLDIQGDGLAGKSFHKDLRDDRRGAGKHECEPQVEIEMGDDSFVQTNAVTRMGQKATRSHQDSMGRKRR